MLIKSVHNNWLHCKSSGTNSHHNGIFPAASVFKKRPLVFKLDCELVKSKVSMSSKCSPRSLPSSLMWTRDGLVMNKAIVLAWATDSGCRRDLDYGYSYKSSAMIFIR